MTAEARRLDEDERRQRQWKRWGPYLSERAWGTVREDYSPYGTAWDYFPHDHARSRAYRWNEDGLAGICDRHQRICFALAHVERTRCDSQGAAVRSHRQRGQPRRRRQGVLLLPRLARRRTPTCGGSTSIRRRRSPTPTWSRRTARRGRQAPEFELFDTGVFAEHRYFDVFVEYAKADPDDLGIRITVINRGPDAGAAAAAADAVVPQHLVVGRAGRTARAATGRAGGRRVGRRARRAEATGAMWLYCDGLPELLFTENDTNTRRLFGSGEPGRFKDGINEYVVHGEAGAVNRRRAGHQGRRALRRRGGRWRHGHLPPPPHRPRAGVVPGRPVRCGLRPSVRGAPRRGRRVLRTASFPTRSMPTPSW